MPASRNARAMILAPRWAPSSPGFAMTTLIFPATARRLLVAELLRILPRRTPTLHGAANRPHTEAHQQGREERNRQEQELRRHRGLRPGRRGPGVPRRAQRPAPADSLRPPRHDKPLRARLVEVALQLDR